MTNTETLTKAIEKAIKNGWKHPSMVDDKSKAEVFVYADSSMVNFGYHLNNKIYYIGGNAEPTNNLIYNHEFAKSLWGEELRHETFIVPKELSKRFAGSGELDIKPLWQYHLQQMVIADDPIKYLRAHMEDK